MISAELAHRILGLDRFTNIGQTPYPEAELQFDQYIMQNPTTTGLHSIARNAARYGNLYVLKRCYEYDHDSLYFIDDIADYIISGNHFHILEWLIQNVNLERNALGNDVMFVAQHLIIKSFTTDVMKYVRLLHRRYPAKTTETYVYHFKKHINEMQELDKLRNLKILKYIHSLYEALIREITPTAIQYYYNNYDAIDYLFIHNSSAFENIYEYLDNNEPQTLCLYSHLIRKFYLKLNDFKNERYNKLAHIYHLYYINPMMRLITN